MTALAQKIQETYIAEKAEDAPELTQDVHCLTVKIAYCPAVKHLRATGRVVSQWFPMTTTAVMETLTNAGNLRLKWSITTRKPALLLIVFL